MPTIKEMRDVCQQREPNEKGKMALKGCLWNRIFSRHVSIYFTYVFVRMHINANQVTALMLAVGFLSFLCVIPDILWINIAAILLFILFNILDCSDGEVARWTKNTSNGGVYLDYAAHVVCNCPLIASVALHSLILKGDVFYGVLAFASITLALWGYYFKLIVPAIGGRESRLLYTGEKLVSSRALVNSIKLTRVLFSDPIFSPMLMILFVLFSHYTDKALVVGIVYSLISASYLASLYFFAGYIKVKKII